MIVKNLKVLGFVCTGKDKNADKYIKKDGDIHYELLAWGYDLFMLTKFVKNKSIWWYANNDVINKFPIEFEKELLTIKNMKIYEKITKKKIFNRKYYKFKDFINEFKQI